MLHFVKLSYDVSCVYTVLLEVTTTGHSDSKIYFHTVQLLIFISIHLACYNLFLSDLSEFLSKRRVYCLLSTFEPSVYINAVVLIQYLVQI